MAINVKNTKGYIGVYRNYPNELYHKAAGLSKSDLDKLHRSPAHYIAAKEHPTPPTDEMIFGTAFHTLVLQPELFEKEFTCEQINGRTKEGKARKAEIEAAGITLITPEDMDRLKAMREAVLKNEIARSLIENTEHELSAFGSLDGTLCKCRPDIWCEKNLTIADIKTTKDAGPDAFKRAVANLRYHVQDAFYRAVWEQVTGVAADAFVFIAVEKMPPYGVALYSLDDDAKDQGQREALDDLRRYRECKDTGHWPAYPKTIEELSLPMWALN